MKALIALIFAASPLAAADVPSGQQATLHEVLVDPQPAKTWVRFRFVTPEIARGDSARTYDEVLPDFTHLCTHFARPYMAKYDLTADTIVISFMDRITTFGKPAPDATQYFEAFRVEGETCIWEEF